MNRQHTPVSGPICDVRGWPVIAPEVIAGHREGTPTGVYQMSNGRRTDSPARYFAHELGEFDAGTRGGRLGERLSANGLAVLSQIDRRTIKQLLEDNNIKG